MSLDSERFYLRMRRTADEIKVRRPKDKGPAKPGSGFEGSSWTENRCLKYFASVGTLAEAHAWALASGNIVEARRSPTQVAPDYSMLPDGSGKTGFV